MGDFPALSHGHPIGLQQNHSATMLHHGVGRGHSSHDSWLRNGGTAVAMDDPGRKDGWSPEILLTCHVLIDVDPMMMWDVYQFIPINTVYVLTHPHNEDMAVVVCQKTNDSRPWVCGSETWSAEDFRCLQKLRFLFRMQEQYLGDQNEPIYSLSTRFSSCPMKLPNTWPALLKVFFRKVSISKVCFPSNLRPSSNQNIS